MPIPQAWLDQGRDAWDDFCAQRVGTHASSIAFFFFMSLIPQMIIYAGLVPLLGISEQDVTAFFRALVPEALGDIAGTVVSEAYDKSGVALSLSLLSLLWSGSQGVAALKDGLNAVYQTEDTRNAALVRLLSVVYLVLFMAYISVATLLVFSGGLAQVLSGIAPWVASQENLMAAINALAVFLAGLLLFALTYTFLPAGTRSLRQQLPGAVATALSWLAFSLVFRVYVGHFDAFSRFYGSLATVALFLFWLYWVFYLLLAGGFLNRRLAARHAES